VKKTAARVLIVDDHPLVRVPLAALINAQPDFVVGGEAGDRAEAMAIMQTEPLPDLVLVDLRLRGSHGLDLLKDLHSQWPKLALIVVSMYDDDNWVERSLRAGARGFVSKAQPPAELLAAMRQVLAGGMYLNDAAARRLATHRAGATGSVNDLPDREYQVLWYLGHGYTVNQIAEHLHVSVPTVETYRSRLKEKLGCDDHTDLLKCAIQWAHSHPTL
jgi:DNA-binding NarL/FixJ family response regulator